MPKNVEIKAKIQDFSAFLKHAEAVSKEKGTSFSQIDTFFNSPNGRLKLRCFVENNRPSQLIFYVRPDQNGPKLSDFSVTPINDAESLKNTLKLAFGIVGEVRKKRTLFMCGQTRIHVDQVEGLGDFMELEVQMKEGQSIEEGEAIAHDLKHRLKVKDSDLITCAYIDMIGLARKSEIS